MKAARGRVLITPPLAPRWGGNVRMEKATGMRASNIVMWATHTHSGPDTCMHMNEGIREQIDPYLDDMAEKVVAGVTDVNGNFEEVTLLKFPAC